MKTTIGNLKRLIESAMNDKDITFEELQSMDSLAASEAQIIIDELAENLNDSFDDDEQITMKDFNFAILNGKLLMQFNFEGSNPQPEWVWHKGTWLDNDENYDEFQKVMRKKPKSKVVKSKS